MELKGIRMKNCRRKDQKLMFRGSQGPRVASSRSGRTAEGVPEELKSEDLKQCVTAKVVACTAVAVRHLKEVFAFLVIAKAVGVNRCSGSASEGPVAFFSLGFRSKLYI